MISSKNIIQLMTIFHVIGGYFRSFNPLLDHKKNNEYKIIFPLLPKFSDEGEIFWFKKCIRYSYYSVELGFSFYRYENLKSYMRIK